MYSSARPSPSRVVCHAQLQIGLVDRLFLDRLNLAQEELIGNGCQGSARLLYSTFPRRWKSASEFSRLVTDSSLVVHTKRPFRVRRLGMILPLTPHSRFLLFSSSFYLRLSQLSHREQHHTRMQTATTSQHSGYRHSQPRRSLPIHLLLASFAAAASTLSTTRAWKGLPAKRGS